MKRVYWLVPCIATTLFAAYYHQWSQQMFDDREYRCPTIPRTPHHEYEGRNGRNEAEADWARGTPQYLMYGLPVHWIGEFGEILKRDYGVERRAVAGCVVDEALVRYVDAYDAVIEQKLKDKYGPDCMEKAEQAAAALYNERNPEPASVAPAN